MPLTPCLDLSALVTCHTLCLLFTSSQSAMFLLNSRMGPFTAPPGIALEDPFSRSYGAMLPSSLTRFLPRALVSLYPPTCVGFGTACRPVSRRFSRKRGRMGSSAASRGLGPAVPGRARGHPSPLSTVLLLRRAWTLAASAGMLACLPSATPFGLALGAD